MAFYKEPLIIGHVTEEMADKLLEFKTVGFWNFEEINEQLLPMTWNALHEIVRAGSAGDEVCNKQASALGVPVAALQRLVREKISIFS